MPSKTKKPVKTQSLFAASPAKAKAPRAPRGPMSAEAKLARGRKMCDKKGMMYMASRSKCYPKCGEGKVRDEKSARCRKAKRADKPKAAPKAPRTKKSDEEKKIARVAAAKKRLEKLRKMRMQKRKEECKPGMEANTHFFNEKTQRCNKIVVTRNKKVDNDIAKMLKKARREALQKNNKSASERLAIMKMYCAEAGKKYSKNREAAGKPPCYGKLKK